MIRYPLAALLLILPALLAQAQTKYFRCTDQWGHAVFSERPCGADATEGSIEGPSAPEQPEPLRGQSLETSRGQELTTAFFSLRLTELIQFLPFQHLDGERTKIEPPRGLEISANTPI
jgi:hypothetical protein